MTIEIDQKLNNFPPVYYITLQDSVERQNKMEKQYQKLGITDYTKIVACDGRIVNYCEDSKIYGTHVNCLDSGHIATILSHFKAIKYWYENSISSSAIFMEDDMMLETINFWNFTWDDIVTRLPEEWSCIQLSLIRGDDAEVPLDDYDIQLRRRSFYNWSAGSYMITRSYAKKILNHYMNNNEYDITIYDYPNYIPCVENVIYIAARPYEFTLPLFVEDVSMISTFYPMFIDQPTKRGQIESSNYVYNWWKENGHKVDINKLMTFKETRYWDNELHD